MDLYTPPSVAYGGAYSIRPYDRVCAILQKTVPFSSPTGPLVGRIQCAPTTGYVQSFKIPMLFPNRIRVVLLKNCPVFVPYGSAWWAYTIRPYDWVCAILQKTVPFSSLSGPSAGRIRYAPTTGYVRSYEMPMQFSNWIRSAFQKTIPFSSPSGPPMGRMRYAPIIGYVRPFKKLSRFRPLRGRLWGVCDTPLRQDTG